MSSLLIKAVGTAILLSPTLTSAQQTQPGWHLYATPYIWASSFKGSVGIGNQTAQADISLSRIIKHFDGAFMLPTEASYGRFGLGAEVIFSNISETPATPGPLFSSASVQVGQFISELSPRYRLIDMKRFSLDAMAGFRYWSLSNSLTLGPGSMPGGDVNLTESWADPFVGARTIVTFTNRWVAQLRADVGGFNVGSQLSWQAQGLLDYRVGERTTVRAGYRQIDVNYDRNRFLYDVGLGGAFLGATVSF